MIIRGIITAVDDPETGWYKANPSIAASNEVGGVSLKGTAMSLGQEVVIFQSGHWGAQAEFGFCEFGKDESSVCEFPPTALGQIEAEAPYSLAANYIAQMAGNMRLVYLPATVTAVGASRLTVTTRWTGETLSLPVSSDLDANEFAVDDGVLIRRFPGVTTEVVGWWLTVGGGSMWVTNSVFTAPSPMPDFSVTFSAPWAVAGEPEDLIIVRVAYMDYEAIAEVATSSISEDRKVWTLVPLAEGGEIRYIIKWDDNKQFPANAFPVIFRIGGHNTSLLQYSDGFRTSGEGIFT